MARPPPEIRNRSLPSAHPCHAGIEIATKTSQIAPFFLGVSENLTISRLKQRLPSSADAQVTILHVAQEAVARGARHGLLGRTHPSTVKQLRKASSQASLALLAAARTLFGRAVEVEARAGRVEHEVIAAAEHLDVLIAGRDGERRRPSPRSTSPTTRFIIDHAPCAALPVWPESAVCRAAGDARARAG
jgi:hypothetical protein